MLYEFTNFINIIVGCYAIGYCLLVRATEYNYSLLYGLLATMIILCLSNIVIKGVENSYYNKFLDYFTIYNLKLFAQKSGQFVAWALALILLIYPLSEFILWILTFILSSETITNFATSYLPYSYHPQCVWFPYFMVNITSLGIGYLVIHTENKYCWGSFCGLLLLYAFFDEQFYDKLAVICNIVGWIGIIGAILYALKDINIETATDSNINPNNSNASTYNSQNNSISQEEQRRIAQEKIKQEQEEQKKRYEKEKQNRQNRQKRTIVGAHQSGNSVHYTYRTASGQGGGTVPGKLEGYDSNYIRTNGSDGRIRMYDAFGHYIGNC